VERRGRGGGGDGKRFEILFAAIGLSADPVTSIFQPPCDVIIHRFVHNGKIYATDMRSLRDRFNYVGRAAA